MAKAEGSLPKTAPYSSRVGGRLYISDVLSAGEQLLGRQISVCGWVKTMREQKQMSFVELNDGSCQGSLQIVLVALAPGLEALKGKCSTGASLQCRGKIVKSPGGKQALEMRIEDGDDQVILLGAVDAAEYPLAKSKLSPEFLRSIAHFRPRSNLFGAVTRIRSALAAATHQFFQSKKFQYIHTPLITAADCEGAGEMFQVTTLLSGAETTPLPRKPAAEGQQLGAIDYSKDFFGKKAFLTVSGQLSLENFCCALSSVYTFGPAFRAENSHTSRHLSELWMIEPELAFADLDDNMDCAEDYLKHCVSEVMSKQREDLDFLDLRVEKGLVARLEAILKQPFERLTYTAAVEILQKEAKEGRATFQSAVEWGVDLGSEHERHLAERVFMKPTIVYNYPKAIKAFYMRLNEDDKTVQAMDVLCPGIGEVIGGSAREERLDVLDRRIAEMGLEQSDYWWYRDLRQHGTVPHCGFGLGFDRLVMFCTGLENIRDAIPFPRYPGHAEF